MQLIGQDEGKYIMLKDKKRDFEKNYSYRASQNQLCVHIMVL